MVVIQQGQSLFAVNEVTELEDGPREWELGSWNWELGLRMPAGIRNCNSRLSEN
jgi:hypothetical protein